MFFFSQFSKPVTLKMNHPVFLHVVKNQKNNFKHNKRSFLFYPSLFMKLLLQKFSIFYTRHPISSEYPLLIFLTQHFHHEKPSIEKKNKKSIPKARNNIHKFLININSRNLKINVLFHYK